MEENTSKKSEAQKGEVLAPNHTADKRQRGLSLRPWPSASTMFQEILAIHSPDWGLDQSSSSEETPQKAQHFG